MPIGSADATDISVQTRELSIPAEESQLSRVRDFIAKCCDEAGFSARETNNTKLAVDEACTNIIKHAYSNQTGDIRIRAEITPGDISIRLNDTGERFDFAGVKDPDLDQYVETGKKGGLGVFLINRLMDDVRYRAGEVGNELTMRKSSHAAISRALPGRISWRGTLRYKFTLQASLGLLVLITAIWSFVFIRQTGTIKEQQATQWLEKRRLAENLAERSKALLLEPEEYSVEQTSLTAFVTRVLDGNPELSYVKVVDSEGDILSSGNIDEIFTRYEEPADRDVLLRKGDNIVWSRVKQDGRSLRDIEYHVRVTTEDTGQELGLGSIHLGVWEDAIENNIDDPRLLTTAILICFFLIGILLIAALVSVFVKPIQVLTDGVRAIGQGSLDGKISVEGPAEIGAIASVFNEITEKFKTAQVGVLEREKLQKEIEVAKQIQHALLPKRHPDISGYDIAPYYQAAKEVGGDYYDFVQVDDDTLGVVVADVSGKGVPGSLVMTMIRTALRMEARGNKNASDVMAKMNDFVTDDMKKGMFVTMFYVILDSKNRVISYASAGHNPMILFRAETNETYYLNPKGFPVGISLPDERLFRRAISLEKIKLKKDDMLVIYTDGVTEAMNARREQYGEDRLIAIIKECGRLHPAEFIKRLDNDIKAFTGGNPQNDDITIVAVKEKLTADDVQFGFRKKLIDMVEVGGMSVKEACEKMKVSPATFYRYRKRMETMGDRGLKNKVLREDVQLKRVSIEERKELLKVIKLNPELGAKRIAEEFNEGKDPSKHLTQRMVYEELKRLGLNTKERRIEFLKRHKLYEEDEEAARKTSREMVEDLLKEVAAGAEAPASETPASTDAEVEPDFMDLGFEERPIDAPVDTPHEERVVDTSDVERLIEDEETELVGDLELNIVRGTDCTVIRIDGHLDSLTTTTLEHKLAEIINKGDLKIVVDLSNVSYISSGGWGILVGEVKRLRERDGDVVLVGMTAEVFDVYELLGFGDILRALPDVEAARAYFRKPLAERMIAEPEMTTPAPRQDTVESSPGGVGAGVAEADTYTAEWDSLRIEAATVGEKGDIAVLSLAGIIDTVSAENLRQAIDRVIQNGIYKIVVDMSLVEYVSSGGWGTFTERLREVRRQGGDVKLFGMDPDVYYIFTMLGFNIVLSSFDILTDAIEDFKAPGEGRPSIHPQHAPGGRESVTETPDVTPQESDDDVQRPQIRIPTPREGEWAQWDEADGLLIGTIKGPIEAVAVEQLDRDLDARLNSKPLLVLLDLGDVDYISSTGWGLVAKYQERLRDWGGALALCRVRQDLFEIFSLLELHRLVDTYTTREDAVEAFRDGLREAAGQRPGETPVDRGTDDIGVSVADDLSDVHGTDAPQPPEPAADEISVEEVLGGPDPEVEQRGDEEQPAAAWDEPGTAWSEPPEDEPGAAWREPPVDEPGAAWSEPPQDEAGAAWSEPPEDEAGTAWSEPPQDEAGAAWSEPPEDEPSTAWSEPPVDEPATESNEDVPSPAVGEPSAPDEGVAAKGPDETVWKTADYDQLEDEEEAERWNGVDGKEGVFVDFSDDSHHVDVDSAVTDGRFAEDKKLRDLGWDQYGQRLKKIKKKEKKKGREDGDK